MSSSTPHTHRVRHRARSAALAVAALLLGSAGFTSETHADTHADAQALVDRARDTYRNFVGDPNMSWFRNHVHEARALMIVPELVKGGFIIGGSGGGGVLLSRDASGRFSPPAFYNMGSVTFGLQIGAEVAEVVLMIMTDRGLDSMYSTEFKLGADASVAAGPVGGGAHAATADVLAFSRTKGVFGGLTVEGAVIAANVEWNAAYYGQPVRPVEILRERRVDNPGASALRASLAGARAPAPNPPVRAPTTSAAYDLLTIQQLLAAKGFDPGPADGKLGPATRRAIRAYQTDAGLAATGEPSIELQRHLSTR
ncbi:MAG: peptidoglycan-binding protein [Ectothiorhodospiraceae bacterium]|nr:peptidoglycan-binding protein [Ectothiorhodospiraceae bacterium]